MSRIDLSSLRVEYPAFGGVLNELDLWLKRHGNVQFIDPVRVARDLHDISEADLIRTLSALVAVGKLKRLYRIRPHSTHTTLDQVFPSIAAIEREMTGSFNEKVCIDNADIVPVYGRATTGE